MKPNAYLGFRAIKFDSVMLDYWGSQLVINWFTKIYAIARPAGCTHPVMQWI